MYPKLFGAFNNKLLSFLHQLLLLARSCFVPLCGKCLPWKRDESSIRILLHYEHVCTLLHNMGTTHHKAFFPFRPVSCSSACLCSPHQLESFGQWASSPTDPFAILELPSPTQNVYEQRKFGQSPDLWGSKIVIWPVGSPLFLSVHAQS